MTPLKFPSENPLRGFVVLFSLFSLLCFSCIKSFSRYWNIMKVNTGESEGEEDLNDSI